MTRKPTRQAPNISPSLDALTLAGAKAKGKRPWFLPEQDTERLMNITLVLAQELAVMRERVDTLERLLARSGGPTQADIEAFTPTREEAAERGAWTQEFLARVFRVLQQDREALTRKAEESSEEVADVLARS